AWARYELTPEKIEMVDGKLLGGETARLHLLGLLLENCGAEAAVRMGNSEIWQRAVALLSDPDANLRHAVQSAARRRGSFDEHFPDLAIEYYRQVATDDFTEDAVNGSGVSYTRDACVAFWESLRGRRDHAPGYSFTKSEIGTIERSEAQGVALL